MIHLLIQNLMHDICCRCRGTNVDKEPCVEMRDALRRFMLRLAQRLLFSISQPFALMWYALRLTT